jgi:RNA polymerase sigma-70 factor (ECF subfamily)
VSTPSAEHQVTRLLRAWSAGDDDAFPRMVQLVYPELRRMAQRCFAGERFGHTIQPTALVNEAYIRLIGIERIQWQDRAHFFAIAARIMRHVLVDHARARSFAKRGGALRRVDFKEALAVSSDSGPEIIRMDESLRELAEFDPRKAQVVEMRYFGGLTAAEIASVLGISQQSVNRDWSLAKAWLARTMTHEGIQ